MTERLTNRTRTIIGEPTDVADAVQDGRLLGAIDRMLKSNRAFLGFEPDLEARFEVDTRTQRISDMRRTILLGLVVFHIYNVAGFVTTPDLALLNVVLRVLVMTPVAFLIVWAVGWVSGPAREAIGGIGMLGATAIPILIFWLGTGPLVSLTTATIWLSVVFANITLPLRFPWACFVSGTTAVAVLAGLHFKGEIATPVAGVLGLDMVTGILFSLVATHRIESANRRDYLVNLREILRGKRLAADNTTLAHLSATDSLTGIPNRRAFARQLEASWAGWQAGRPFAVILIDVDYFKRFNDRYGHGAGDACLRAISAVLSESAGAADAFVSRYGGEEFAVLTAARDAEAAFDLADRLRRAIADQGLAHGNRGDGLSIITISVGVAAICGATPSAAALVEMADVALYAAKSNGRNRTCRGRTPGDTGPDIPARIDFADWGSARDRPPIQAVG